MTIGSLFSGIGGLERGLEMCGLGPVVWQADSDPYARAVLAKHWPEVRRYEDVRDIDENAERPDIICGGFPCQDISDAGKRVGIDGERSGLWSEIVRIVRILRPSFVFVENVAALLYRGMERVLGDLASVGFDAEWAVFSASEAGAPQVRERVFVLAYAIGKRCPSVRRISLGDSEENLSRVYACRDGKLRRIPDAGICRVAHGVPGRLDRHRVLGNAVVPQQAALAWRTLTARAR